MAKLTLEDHAAVVCAMLNSMQLLAEDSMGSERCTPSLILAKIALDTPSLVLAKLALEMEDHTAVACAMLNAVHSLIEDGGTS